MPFSALHNAAEPLYSARIRSSMKAFHRDSRERRVRAPHEFFGDESHRSEIEPGNPERFQDFHPTTLSCF